MTEDQQRIERLEDTLGTLIAWLARELGADAVEQLLVKLTEAPNDR